MVSGSRSSGTAFAPPVISFWLTLGSGLVGLAFVLMAAALDAVLIVAVAAFAVFALAEMASCIWIAGHWEEWEARAGADTRRAVDGWRRGRIMRHVAAGVSRGSALWFVAVAALMSSAVAVTVARILHGRPVPPRLVIWACVGRGAFVAALAVLMGRALGAAGTRF